MLTIYGVYRSRALRPLWLLEECGTAYSHVPVIQAYRLPDPSATGTHAAPQNDAPQTAVLHTASPEFLSINPQGQVPAMRDGSLLLTESLAICLHIARQYGGSLGPSTPEEAALIDQWAMVGATALEPSTIDILYTLRDGLGETEEGKAVLGRSLDRLRRPLARLDRHLDGRDWLLDRFTVADVVLAECLRYGQGQPAMLRDTPQVTRWLAAAQARPAFQKVWAARLAEPE